MKYIVCLFVLLLNIPMIYAIDDVDNMPDLSDIPSDALPVVYGEMILPEEWTLFFIYQDEYQVNVAWQHEGAVVITTHMEFVSSEQREEYVDNINFHLDVIMDIYSPYTVEADCEQDNIYLYQMDAINLGIDFEVNYYMWAVSENELWMVGLYLPIHRSDELEPLSALFQPEFTACPIESDK